MEQIIKNIEKLERKAEKAFLKSCEFTDEIERLLQSLYPDEKDKINGVLYMLGDGVFVIYDEMEDIPLSDFLEGERMSRII